MGGRLEGLSDLEARRPATATWDLCNRGPAPLPQKRATSLTSDSQGPRRLLLGDRAYGRAQPQLLAVTAPGSAD